MVTQQFDEANLKRAITYIHNYCMKWNSCGECPFWDGRLEYGCPLDGIPCDWDIDCL